MDSRFCLELSMVRVADRRQSGLPPQNRLPWDAEAPRFCSSIARSLLAASVRPSTFRQSSRPSRVPASQTALPSARASGGGITHLLVGRSLPASVTLPLIVPPDRRKGPNPSPVEWLARRLARLSTTEEAKCHSINSSSQTCTASIRNAY